MRATGEGRGSSLCLAVGVRVCLLTKGFLWVLVFLMPRCSILRIYWDGEADGFGLGMDFFLRNAVTLDFADVGENGVAFYSLVKMLSEFLRW